MLVIYQYQYYNLVVVYFLETKSLGFLVHVALSVTFVISVSLSTCKILIIVCLSYSTLYSIGTAHPIAPHVPYPLLNTNPRASEHIQYPTPPLTHTVSHLKSFICCSRNCKPQDRALFKLQKIRSAEN